MAIQILSNFSRVTLANYFLTEDVDNKGGYRIVATVTDRNNILTSHRKQGMWVRVLADSKVYVLESDLTTWTEQTFGVTAHSGLSGLLADDHTQYTLLAGRSGGQIQFGGTATGDDFTIRATSNGSPSGANVIIGDAGTSGVLVGAATTFMSTVAASAIGPNAGQQHTLPGVASDVVALLAATQTFTNKSISGATNTLTNIPNSALTNSSITLNSGTGISVTGSPVSLGGAATINIDSTVATLTGTQTLTNKTLTSPVINGSVTTSGLTMPTFSMGGTTITSHGTPVASTDVANKAYVDSVAQGLKVRPPVRALAASNVASLSGTTTQDGVSLVATDRILLIAQSTASQNGIWVINAGAWTRPSDFATGSSQASAFTFVEEGTIYADSGWTCTTNPPNDVVDTDSLAFVQFSSAGVILAGTGLTKTGNTLSITNTAVTAGSYGSATQVSTFTVNAQGQLTAASNTSIQITESQVTSLTTDLGNRALTATTLTAGAGLTGGGDLSTNRTFDVGAGTGITVNANDVAIDTSIVPRLAVANAFTMNNTFNGTTIGGGTIVSPGTLDIDVGTDFALSTGGSPGPDRINISSTGNVDITSNRTRIFGDAANVELHSGGVEQLRVGADGIMRVNVLTRFSAAGIEMQGGPINGGLNNNDILYLRGTSHATPTTAYISIGETGTVNIIAGSGTCPITLAGATTINSSLSFLKEVNHTIAVNNSTTSNTAGGFLTIQSANGAGTASGGAFSAMSGNGGNGTGAGAGGDAGALSITGGNGGNGGATGVAGAGSAMFFNTGDAGTSGTTSTTGGQGGDISLYLGQGADAGGGSGTGGRGGGFSTNGNSGKGGAASATGNAGNGGVFTIAAGKGGAAASGGGTAGNGGLSSLNGGVGGGGAGSNGGGAGGSCSLSGGNGGVGTATAAAGGGGICSIIGGTAGGAGGGVGGTGGFVSIAGGNSTGNNNGGDVDIGGGDPGGSGVHGSVYIGAGPGHTRARTIQVGTGTETTLITFGNTGASGSMNIRSVAMTINGASSTGSIDIQANGSTIIYVDSNKTNVGFSGGIKYKRTAVADTNYTVLTSDYIIAMTTLTTTRTITLPAPATAGVGATYIIKDESGSASSSPKITIAGASGNIDGAASFDIIIAYGSITVYSNGSNYFIV